MIFTTAVIADIHFGAVKPAQLMSELRVEFLSFIKDRYIDMIVIAGDFYNSVLSLNSQSALASFEFMYELLTICEQNKIRYVRIIEGTLSHDNFQIRNFSQYEEMDTVNFRIITEACDEVIEGMNILYIPEEYKTNPKSYYKPYFTKPKKYYDMIFGHGMFKETSFTTELGENSVSKAPILDSKLVGSICKGPVFFGHIHTSQIIRKHIYYVGSFSRWVYGQEEEKGFYLTAYNTDTSEYAVEFVVNHMAKRYDTLKLFLDNWKKPIEEFISFVKPYKHDNLRVQIIIEAGERDYSYEVNFLKEYYTGKPGYKIEVIDKREKLKKDQTDEKVNKIFTEYNFLFDKSLPVDVKISKYIKRKYSEEMSTELIKSLLHLDSTKNK